MKTILLLLVTLVLAGVPQPALAQSRLQAEIDALPDNGKLVIPAGVYAETLRVEGKRIRIIGRGRTGDKRTELVGTDPGRPVITFTNGGGGIVKNIAISGGSAGIAGAVAAEELPLPLKLRRIVVRESGNGVAGRFSQLEITGVDLSDAIARGLFVEELSFGMKVKKSVIDHANEAGIFVALDQPGGCSSAVVIQTTSVVANSFNGIVVVGDRCPVFIDRTTLVANTGAGILFVETGAMPMAVRDSSIQGNIAFPDGSFGDGIDALFAKSVEITSCLVEDSARAGIGNFGSHIRLVDNDIRCNLFDMNGEIVDGEAWSFDGSSGNVCGCETPDTCGSQTSALSAPPIEP